MPCTGTIQPLYTIGYEGLSVDALVNELAAANVQRLLDVRCVPVSRKRGFSKQPLASEMLRRGIDYVHIAALGNPKEGREAARAGETKRFLNIYNRHLETYDARLALIRAAALASARSSCLLCFEHDSFRCHRSIVARAMLDINHFRVINLLE
jgi:uncharacterized protein (DUF488 family)